MANRSASTFKKMEREEAKRRKRTAKEAKKIERKEMKQQRDSDDKRNEIDPDIAGIVPGPQPKPEE